MAFNSSIDFDMINLNDISEEELNTAEGMNKVADNIMLNVNAAIGRVYKEYNSNAYADKTLLFEDVYIGGNPVNTLLNNLEQEGNAKFSKVQRNQIGSYMVARAILDKTEVLIMPYQSNNADNVKKLNDLFTDIPPKTISLWDKFLALLGVTSSKQKIMAHTKSAAVKQHLQALEADVKEDHTNRRTEIIQDNLALADEYRQKHSDFKEKSLEEQRQINEMYLKHIPTEAFRTGEKKLMNIKGIDAREFPMIAVCAMLKNGYTLKQACDPSFTEGREQVAQELSEINRLQSTENKDDHAHGNKLLGEIFRKGGQKFLEQPVPSNETLNSFCDSKTPFYLTTLATLGFTIYQPLERTNDLTPENEILISKLNNASSVGPLWGIMMSSVAKSLDPMSEHKATDEKKLIEKTRKKMSTKVMRYEILKQRGYQTAIDGCKTMDEYIVANQEASLQNFTLEYMLTPFIEDYLLGKNADPIKFSDIMENKVSVYDMVKKDYLYKSQLEISIESAYAQGTHAQIGARAELAKNVTRLIAACSDDTTMFDDETKLNEFARNLMHRPSFIKLTDFEPEKIKALNDDPHFASQLANKILEEDNPKTERETKAEPKPEKANEKNVKKSNNGLEL